MSGFDVLSRMKSKNNQLLIAGKTAAELATIAGGAPLYVYDAKAMTETMAQLRQAMPDGLKIHYAIKANPHPGVVQQMAKLADGLDLASHQELLLALSTGTPPERISFAGPAKSAAELHAAICAGVEINVESPLELNRIIEFGTALRIKPNIALRVNANFELRSAGMKMAGGPKPFGIDSEQLPEIIRALHPYKINLSGLHVFTGSQNLNPNAIVESHNAIFSLADHLAQVMYQHGFELSRLNIGGGLGIPYFEGEKTLCLTKVSANLQSLMDTRSQYLKRAEIVMELGRYLVAEAGVYLCRVTDIKDSRGTKYVLTNGGMHHHLANSGNFGQLVRRNYPTVIANRLEDHDLSEVEIAGPLCTPLDIVAAKIKLPTPQVGDYIAILQSGAYGASASPNGFLSHPQMQELLL